jgi:hypothetical protein
LVKLGKNWKKSGNLEKNREKLGKIEKIGKVGEKIFPFFPWSTY